MVFTYVCPMVLMPASGVPLVYELNAELKPVRHYYLGNPDEIAAKMAAVAAQGSVKK